MFIIDISSVLCFTGGSSDVYAKTRRTHLAASQNYTKLKRMFNRHHLLNNVDHVFEPRQI